MPSVIAREINAKDGKLLMNLPCASRISTVINKMNEINGLNSKGQKDVAEMLSLVFLRKLGQTLVDM